MDLTLVQKIKYVYPISNDLFSPVAHLICPTNIVEYSTPYQWVNDIKNREWILHREWVHWFITMGSWYQSPLCFICMYINLTWVRRFVMLISMKTYICIHRQMKSSVKDGDSIWSKRYTVYDLHRVNGIWNRLIDKCF